MGKKSKARAGSPFAIVTPAAAARKASAGFGLHAAPTQRIAREAARYFADPAFSCTEPGARMSGPDGIREPEATALHGYVWARETGSPCTGTMPGGGACPGTVR